MLLPSLVHVGDVVQMLRGRAGQHPDEDDAVVVDGNNLGDGRVGLRVADENERSGHELTATLDVVDVRVRKAVGVAPVVVNPEVEAGFHTTIVRAQAGIRPPSGGFPVGHTGPDHDDFVRRRFLAPGLTGPQLLQGLGRERRPPPRRRPRRRGRRPAASWPGWRDRGDRQRCGRRGRC